MSSGAGPSRRNDESSSSWLKGKRNGGSSLGISYSRDQKDLSYDSFTIWSGIYEQSLELQDFDVDNDFLGFVEAQGWLLALTNPGLFRWQKHKDDSADDIANFLGVPNEWDVTYFENVTLDVF